MTVPTQTNKAIFTANGVTTEFPFTFGTLPTADLVVTLIDGDTETVVNPSDYTVRGAGRDDGGSVVFNDPPASGLTILIQRLVPYTQPTDYKNQGSFYPRTHERSFDRATMQIQQLAEEVGRSLRLPASVQGVNLTLPAPSPLSSLVWSTDGTRLENGDPDRVGDMLLRPELSQAEPGKGASLVAFKQDGDSTVARTVEAKLRDTVNVRDFGAVVDGATDDSAAFQAFVNHLSANGGYGVLPEGEILITKSMVLPTPNKGFTIAGSGWGTVVKMRNTTSPSNSVPFAFIGPEDVTLERMTIDCGYSVTGIASSGFSFRNAARCTVRGVRVLDHRNAAGMMFVTTDNEAYRDCHIIDCHSDSYGNGQNGFLLEGMYYSSIQNCNVAPLDPAGSPCMGLQLKNKCRHSYILGGSARGCKAATAFGGDGATYGDGPHNCYVDGVIAKDCLDAGIFGKSTNCWVRYYADMTNSPAPTANEGYALNVAGFNESLRVEVNIKGVQSGRTAIRVGSHDTSIRVPYADGIGDKLLQINTGVQRCRLVLDDAADPISNITDLVTDNSGNATNEILFLRNLPVSGLAGTGFIRFPVPGNPNNWISATPTVMGARLSGADVLSISASYIAPGSDNSASAGRPTFRYSTVYAATGTINTSDEREKQDDGAIPDAWLDAWADVEFVRYRWRDAVAEKGDGARWHIGLIAQRVRDAFAARGLDATEIGLLCYDEWPDIRDDEGDLVMPAGNRWGIRADECLFMEAALMRREVARLRGGAAT